MANASVPAMVDAELEAFSVLARGLTPAQWTTPSLCAAWTVRDIIEHTAFHTHRGLQDVRRPLGIGRDYPDAAMRATLDLCTSAHGNILVLGSRRRPGRGLRLQANDIDWSKGRGAEVVGSAEALLMAASAEHTLSRLPEGVAAAVVEFLVGPLLESPARAGRPLQREPAGYHSARRGAYRIVYRILTGDHVVRVVRIEHRADVYRTR